MRYKKVQTDLNTATTNFIRECNEYVETQEKMLSTEIAKGTAASPDDLTRFYRNIKLGSDLSDLSLACNFAAYKTQATSDKTFVVEAAASLDKIDAGIAQLQQSTYNETNRKTLNDCQHAAKQFRKSMEELVDAVEKIIQVNAKRGAAADPSGGLSAGLRLRRGWACCASPFL